jgi:hypothetical protein
MTRFKSAKNGTSNFGELVRLQKVKVHLAREQVVTLSFGVSPFPCISALRMPIKLT